MKDGYDGGDSSGAWFMGKQLLSKWLSLIRLESYYRGAAR
jgi:hypothetical protein